MAAQRSHEMSPDARDRSVAAYDAALAAIRAGLNKLGERRQVAPDTEQSDIDGDILELEGERSRVTEEKRAFLNRESAIQAPDQATVDRIKILVTTVEGFTVNQTTAQAIMEGVGDVLKNLPAWVKLS